MNADGTGILREFSRRSGVRREVFGFGDLDPVVRACECDWRRLVFRYIV